MAVTWSAQRCGQASIGVSSLSSFRRFSFFLRETTIGFPSFLLRMINLIRTVVALVWCATLDRAQGQYGSPSPSSSYGAAPVSSYSYAASPAMQAVSAPAQSVQYPSVNLPLLSFPATLGNANLGTVVTTAAVATPAAAVATGGNNYLATLPASPVANIAPYNYAFGVYANDYDASRDYYYNHSAGDIYALNTWTSNLTGYGALNLSSPSAVAAANWWSAYPYQLAAWNDAATTQASATTAATTVAGASAIVNASTYYAAFQGNLNGIGIPGLGLSVPGPAPNVSIITPGLSYAYNVGSPAAAAAAATPAAASSSSYTSNSGYASAPVASYGRRR
ncbi:hypothetical protein BV898_12522 [Hypsibius exemplaris]|uniref:Uncharacterized protein n=1 Tax=Hypsibius exemplaris TaxID=2072580 RepID=A0A1W0WDD0_HYPEX|nr:hypothetical protein BV898_12522 [Hypsibius exemplaris]